MKSIHFIIAITIKNCSGKSQQLTTIQLQKCIAIAKSQQLIAINWSASLVLVLVGSACIFCFLCSYFLVSCKCFLWEVSTSFKYMQPHCLTSVPTAQCITHVLETCTYFSQKYLQNSKTKNSTKKYTTHDIAISFYDIAPFRTKICLKFQQYTICRKASKKQ